MISIISNVNLLFLPYSPEHSIYHDSVETEITITGGVVGPTVSQTDANLPINITSILDRPQVIS